MTTRNAAGRRHGPAPDHGGRDHVAGHDGARNHGSRDRLRRPPRRGSDHGAAATTTPVRPAQGGGRFFEDFAGNTGLERFSTGVYHRDDDVVRVNQLDR